VAWSSDRVAFRELPIGPSRHLVRFVLDAGRLYALKEEPIEIAQREYEVLRRLEAAELPAVIPVGLSEMPQRSEAILVTRYLAHSLQYRRLLMRLGSGSEAYRDRLLDAMASLLVDLHRGGVYWGDCSLANTLFRRDGDKIQAYLVDAETSEVHPSLSAGQRAYDLEVLVENVAFGLADLAVYNERPDELEGAIDAAESVRTRYRALWDELHAEVQLGADDRFGVAARVRRLNDLGFAVDEIELEPGDRAGRLRLRVAVTTRRFHIRELERLTGIRALEGQARILMNDLREYRAYLEWHAKRSLTREEGAARWQSDVFEPTVERLRAALGGERDLVQAYCDVLEHKWLLSEKAGRDVGLGTAIDSYLAIGAPAPEVAPDLEADPEEQASADAVAGLEPELGSRVERA